MKHPSNVGDIMSQEADERVVEFQEPAKASTRLLPQLYWASREWALWVFPKGVADQVVSKYLVSRALPVCIGCSRKLKVVIGI